ncbi:Hypothetical predicted protein [Mytilus galloprovincialis]|uniref:Uncharacterized protein n=1 Tax=Mytilus galloprovincialis TaxID=29158 RepID=A0A8B6H1H8_MYTGA|nr:Hypothetical predicted protein [Mytilus galloprovincialis]
MYVTRLEEAGFHYNTNDDVACRSCGAIHTNWRRGSTQMAIGIPQEQTSVNLTIIIGSRPNKRNQQTTTHRFTWTSADVGDPRNMDIELPQYYNSKFGKQETNGWLVYCMFSKTNGACLLVEITDHEMHCPITQETCRRLIVAIYPVIIKKEHHPTNNDYFFSSED